MFIITEGHIPKLDKRNICCFIFWVSPSHLFHAFFCYCLAVFFHYLLLLKCKKFIDPVDSGNRRLNRLNLHSEALHRGEYLWDIVDDRNRSSGRHSKEGQYRVVSGRGKQHDNCDNHRIHYQYHRGVNRIIKIGALHRCITLPDISVVTLFHVCFLCKTMDCADIVKRLRHMTGCSSDSLSVFNLRRQHIFLDMSGKPE